MPAGRAASPCPVRTGRGVRPLPVRTRRVRRRAKARSPPGPGQGSPQPGAGRGSAEAGTASWGAHNPVPEPRSGRLRRSRTHKVAGGVCGGLGRYFDLDPVIFRVPLVVLSVVVGGTGIRLLRVRLAADPRRGGDPERGAAAVVRPGGGQLALGDPGRARRLRPLPRLDRQPQRALLAAAGGRGGGCGVLVAAPQAGRGRRSRGGADRSGDGARSRRRAAGGAGTAGRGTRLLVAGAAHQGGRCHQGHRSRALAAGRGDRLPVGPRGCPPRRDAARLLREPLGDRPGCRPEAPAPAGCRPHAGAAADHWAGSPCSSRCWRAGSAPQRRGRPIRSARPSSSG